MFIVMAEVSDATPNRVVATSADVGAASFLKCIRTPAFALGEMRLAENPNRLIAMMMLIIVSMLKKAKVSSKKVVKLKIIPHKL